MNGQRPSGQRPSGQRQAPRRPADMNDALNERYEEMVAPGKRADDINHGKYADLSTFESKGHRKIDPAVMRAKKRKELIRRAIPVCAVALVAVIGIWVYFGMIRPASMYDEAVAFFEKGDYSSAEELFGKLDDYKDTRNYTAYIDARNAYKSGDTVNAKIIYESLGDFYDSKEMAAKLAEDQPSSDPRERDYASAMTLLNKGDFLSAKAAFEALGDYLDSAEKALLAGKEHDYEQAIKLLSAGDTDGAKALFEALGDFRDSREQLEQLSSTVTPPPVVDVNEQKYQQALAELAEGDYREANVLFNEISGYLDSKTYADYTYAVMCMSYGDYGTAMVCFDACGDFLDSADRLYHAKYNYAMDVYGERDYARLPEVIGLFESLGGYLDSASMLEGARSQYREHAIYTYNGGDKAAALAMFETLAGYSDCDSWAQTIRDELA